MARVFLVVVVALLAALCVADALKLPAYIKPCRANDPKLNECGLKNGREAISKFVNGDRKYKIPNLNPLTLYNFNVDSGSNAVGIKLTFKEAQIHGLAEADIKDLKFDTKKRTMEVDLFFPKISIIGDYDITGRVLILPITGKGPANITVTDITVYVSINFDLAPKKKGGKDYIQLTTSSVTFDIGGRAFFKLDNLFNGDRLLGDNMNVFLNENWREVAKELGPSVADSIGEVVRLIVQQIVEVVPYENVIIRD